MYTLYTYILPDNILHRSCFFNNIMNEQMNCTSYAIIESINTQTENG